MPPKRSAKAAPTKSIDDAVAAAKPSSRVRKAATKEVEPAAAPTTATTTTKRSSRQAGKQKDSKSAAAVAAAVAASDAATTASAAAPPLVRKKSDPALRTVQKKASKSLAPPHPESQDDYATAYGTVAGQAKVVSWNVNGINAWINNGGVAVLDKDKPDVVCLQEVKANEPDVAKWTKALGNWPHVYFSCCSTQKGYAGTAVLSRVKPLSVHYGLDDDGKHEPEGRVILVEFAGFILVNTYVPNSGMKLENLAFRQEWDAKLLARMLALSKKLGNKPLLWTGDLNVAHTDWDCARPDERRNKVPGVCDEERAGLDNALAAGFVDLWRQQNPGTQHYTFWSYKFQGREKNLGYRLDYWLASHGLDKKLGQAFIRSTAEGSDHVPLGVLVDPKLLA
jgi:exodeoxyribonuclease III